MIDPPVKRKRGRPPNPPKPPPVRRILSDTEARADMRYWFPRLQKSGVPVPKTRMILLDDPATFGEDLLPLKAFEMDRKAMFAWLVDRVQNAAGLIVGPCFLRTGHTSAKQEWDKTCYTRMRSQIRSHVRALIDYSIVTDGGLPCGTWAVREMLRTLPAFRAFRGMPIVREFRVFLHGGLAIPICVHPYWPAEALEGHVWPEFEHSWRAQLAEMSLRLLVEDMELVWLVEQVAPHFEGAWSMDCLETSRGWVVTDMAPAEVSWHWPGCPEEGRMKA